jgi:transcription antitermination factor NusG
MRSTMLTDAAYRLGRYFQSEIIPGVVPQWHVAITVPGQDRVAKEHLIGRRFAIYIPETAIDARGNPLPAKEPLWPGYIFLLVWDVVRHFDFIAKCPGVIDLLRTSSGNIAQIGLDKIKEIQAFENEKQPLIRARKRRKGWRRAKEEDVEDIGFVSIRCWDALRDDPNIDVEQKTNIFRRALGL